MARAFRARRGKGPLTYAADLDAGERRLLVDLMDEVVALLDPPDVPDASTDPFGALVADLGDLGSWPDDASPRARSGRPDGIPGDPALARLLPTGSREDDAAATEFRRLTEATLRRRKADHLRSSTRALRGSDRVVLDGPGAAAFVAALTDVRLVLAERLGIADEDDVTRLEERAHADPASELAVAVAIYDFLAWLQETLTDAMLRGLES